MRFYDMPDYYDLFFSENFHSDCENFYQEIFGKKKYKDVLDCAVGTGQMLIPLAKMGYVCTGTDINQIMTRRASQNFARFGLMADIRVCDFRNLKEKIKNEFDIVMCSGNSLGHVKNEDIHKSIKSMDSVLRPGGMIYIDSKNWDNILKRQQRFYLFNPIIRDRGRVNYVQVWDYRKDGSIFFNYLITEEINNKIETKKQFYEIYYPFSLDTILDCLNEMKYENIKVCKLGDTTQKEIAKIEWYTVTGEKPIEGV